MKLGLYSPEKAPDHRPHRAAKPQLLTPDALDGRTNAAKTFDRIRAGIRADLGGDNMLTTVEVALIDAFAGATIQMHDLNTRLLLGQQIDSADHSAAINAMAKLAARIGGRRARNVTPHLHDYLEARATESAS
jgi:hypothetical protein